MWNLSEYELSMEVFKSTTTLDFLSFAEAVQSGQFSNSMSYLYSHSIIVSSPTPVLTMVIRRARGKRRGIQWGVQKHKTRHK